MSSVVLCVVFPVSSYLHFFLYAFYAVKLRDVFLSVYRWKKYLDILLELRLITCMILFTTLESDVNKLSKINVI